MKVKEIGMSPVTIEDLGHTDSLHINVTYKDLIARVLYPDVRLDGTLENYCKFLATKFLNEEVAIKAIQSTLLANQDKLKIWTEDRYEKRIYIEHFFRTVVGEGIAKGTNFDTHYPMTGVRMILSLGYNGDLFDIVTAYPIPNPAINEKIKQDRNYFKNHGRN